MSVATASLAEPTREPLDTTIRLVAPERVAFLYPLAGPFRRAGAYLIDFVAICGLVLTTFFVLSILTLGSGAGLGIILAVAFALWFGYGATLEALWNGQTLGKRAMGLRVVSVEGVPITATQAFLRNLLWGFDGFAFGYMPAVASMMLTRRFQRLGDLAAGTMVVVETRPARSRIVSVEDKSVEAVLMLLPGRIDAGPALARALSDYVKHRRRFSPARREEMTQTLARAARIKYNLPANATGDAIVAALHRRVFLGA